MGVLGLPYAFSYLGWTAGLLFLGLCFMTSLYTSYLLAALHEGPDGTRRNRYKDLGQAVLGELPDGQNPCAKVTGRPGMQRACMSAALLWDEACMSVAPDLQEASCSHCAQWSTAGRRLGLWLTAPCQWSVMFGLAITYTVTAGQSFQVGSCLVDQAAQCCCCRLQRMRKPCRSCGTACGAGWQYL